MTFTWQAVLAIGFGGFLGAVFRAYIVHFANRYVPLELPLGVLLVNVIGSFLIGIVFAYINHYNMSETTKLFLTTGFLGAMTTYSTFAIESYFLLSTSLYLAILNMALNLFGTIIAAAIGYKILSLFIK
ncbi:MAG: fluoride efflux transporter CrcB [Campylobacterota bacterium]